MALHRLNLETYAFSVREFASTDESMRSQYLLDPPYQRGSVWGTTRRVNLIRSILMGLPIGAVTINERDHRHESYDETIFAVIVDGKQRIETLRAFIDSRFAVPAWWFSADATGVYITEGATFERIEADGNTTDGVFYHQLSSLGKGMFNRATVGVNHAKVTTVGEEAELFLLVNYGGIPTTDIDRERAKSVAETP